VKILIMQFSASSYHFIPLRSKYSPQHHAFKYPQSVFSLNVRQQVSRPYKSTGKIIILLCSNVYVTQMYKITAITPDE
jgi:hypothetical protein